MITEFVVIFLITIFIYFLSKIFNRKFPKGSPPGVIGIPVIGAAYKLEKESHKSFNKLREKYGDIFSFDFGSFNAVIINDYKMVKTIMNDKRAMGRPLNIGFISRCIDLIPRGIIWVSENHWREQRRFILKVLKDLGMGRKSMDKILHDEVQELINEFLKDGDSPVDISERLQVPIINSLWGLVSIEKFENDNQKLTQLITSLNQDLEIQSLLFLIPGLMSFKNYLPWIGPKINGLLKNAKIMTDFMRDAIELHKKTYQSGINRDLLDAYLEEINKTKDPKSSFYKEEGYLNLTMVMHDLFFAGAETTSTVLGWAICLLAVHLDAQEKFQKEIDQIIGKNRLPSLHDKQNMPFTEALIMEILRVGNIVPQGAAHRVLEDIDNFYGYKIPKDTYLICNLYAILTEEKIWGDPQNFRPERFLSKDEKSVVYHEAYFPFQGGKRNCLRENFAKDQLFLFLINIFQRFQIVSNPNYPKIEKVEHHFQSTYFPVYFPMQFIDRFN